LKQTSSQSRWQVEQQLGQIRFSAFQPPLSASSQREFGFNLVKPALAIAQPWQGETSGRIQFFRAVEPSIKGSVMKRHPPFSDMPP
jgi:hypothetical protein